MNTGRTVLALGALLLCASCLPPGPPASQGGLPRGITIPVHSDQSGDPALDQAEAWWDSLAGRQLFTTAIDNRWDGVWIYHIATANCTDPGARACTSVADANGDEQAPGPFPYRWCDVNLEPGENAWNVIAHELGHCLGLDHVQGRPSIMGATDADPSNPQADQQMLESAGY